MANKRRKRIVKPKTPVIEPEVQVTKPEVQAILKVSTLEQATELVDQDYRKPLVLEYTVLENGHVFYGHNRNVALKFAKKFKLEFFDVKLK